MQFGEAHERLVLPCNLILVALKFHRMSSVHLTHCLSGKSLWASVDVLNEPSLWGWFHLTQTWRKKECMILAPETTGDNLPSLPSHFTNPVRVTHCGQEEEGEGEGVEGKEERIRKKGRRGEGEKERRREEGRGEEGEGRMGRGRREEREEEGVGRDADCNSKSQTSHSFVAHVQCSRQAFLAWCAPLG